MITLHLTRGKDLEGIYIRLPAPQEKIEEAMTRLDAISEDTVSDCRIDSGGHGRRDPGSPGVLPHIGDPE